MDESGNPPSGEETPNELQACCYCHCQGNIQATLRPAIWCPGFRSLHLYKEKWHVFTNPIVCVEEVISAARKLNSENHGGRIYELAKVNHDTHFVQLNLYSCEQLLSVVDFLFTQDDKTAYTCAKVRCFSTGCIPVVVPLSFVWNALLCLFPFYDCGASKKWIKNIRQSLPLNVEVVKSGRSC